MPDDGAYIVCHSCLANWRAWDEPGGSITSVQVPPPLFDGLHDQPPSDTERGIGVVLSDPELRHTVMAEVEAWIRQERELRDLPTTEASP